MIGATDSSAVVVAVIGLLGVLFTAVVAAVTQVFLRRHVGKSNGNGTLMAMVEHALESHGVLSHDVAELQRTGADLQHELHLVKGAVEQHDATDIVRFDRLEAMLAAQNDVRDERDQ